MYVRQYLFSICINIKRSGIPFMATTLVISQYWWILWFSCRLFVSWYDEKWWWHCSTKHIWLSRSPSLLNLDLHQVVWLFQLQWPSKRKPIISFSVLIAEKQEQSMLEQQLQSNQRVSTDWILTIVIHSPLHRITMETKCQSTKS